MLFEGKAEILFEPGDDRKWDDIYRRIACRYVDEASADYYLTETKDQPRALIGVDRAKVKVTTWRMPTENEPYSGISGSAILRRGYQDGADGFPGERCETQGNLTVAVRPTLRSDLGRRAFISWRSTYPKPTRSSTGRFAITGWTELRQIAARFTSCTNAPASPASWPHPALPARSPTLGLALPGVAAVSERHRVGETGHRGPVAPARVSALLALAVAVRAKIARSRNLQADPRDVHRQPALGCAAHPR